MSKSASYGCLSCGVKYRLGRETTLRCYVHQPWFNHLVSICPKCGASNIEYELVEEAIVYILQNQSADDPVRHTMEGYASEAVWRDFCLKTGKSYPGNKTISARQQKHIDAVVAFEAWLLEHNDYGGESSGILPPGFV